MKEGWNSKPLEALCRINYGTRVVQKKDGGSKYPVYGGGGATFKMDIYNRSNCLVVSRFAMSPKCTRFVSGDFFLNDSGLTIETLGNEVSQSYMERCLIGKNDFIYTMGKGVAQKNLDMKEFRNMQVCFPVSIAEQQHIVDELDCLTGIIEKKKAQLTELDNLAKSIFYEMFGDDVVKKEKWQVLPLGEVGYFQRGGGFLKTDFVERGYPCIHYGQIHTRFGIATYKHLTELNESLLEKTKIASCGDIIMAITSEDVEGSCKSTAWMGKYDIAVGSHAAIYRHTQNPIYVSYYFKSSRFNAQKQRHVHGIKVMEIKPTDIATIDIPLPPLPLQEEFAQKIEAIEKQKELIKKSIAEAETLFNSRMDNYFN